jgi:hypothetical protein
MIPAQDIIHNYLYESNKKGYVIFEFGVTGPIHEVHDPVDPRTNAQRARQWIINTLEKKGIHIDTPHPTETN